MIIKDSFSGTASSVASQTETGSSGSCSYAWITVVPIIIVLVCIAWICKHCHKKKKNANQTKEDGENIFDCLFRCCRKKKKVTKQPSVDAELISDLPPFVIPMDREEFEQKVYAAFPVKPEHGQDRELLTNENSGQILNAQELMERQDYSCPPEQR